MPTITLNSYNQETDSLDFTTTGISGSSLIYIQTSNNGIFYTTPGVGGSSISPRTGVIVSVGWYIRLYNQDSGVYSNVIQVENDVLAPPVRTPIAGPSQISFIGSPVYLRLQNTLQSSSIKMAIAELWIWSGNQNAILGNANETLIKSVVSNEDDYIEFRIDAILKSYLEKPNSGTWNNQPGFGYNVNDLPAVSGQGIFWQIRTKITSEEGVETLDYDTNFATLGWKWNWEQNGQSNNPIIRYGSNGFEQTVKKWYNPNVPKYWNQEFVFGQSIDVATTTNMISMAVEAKTRTRCTRDSCILVYIDKRGLWDVFTPHGKILITPKVEIEVSSRNFRDSTKINNSIAHSKSRDSIKAEQVYTINTGTIDESDVQRVEELIYSPKIYLVRFMGDIVYEISGGITIDSTFVTIDDTNITIDNTPITPTMVPYFNTFQQIPVIISDTDFVRKTLINDKNQIDYNIKLEETTNKIY